MRSVVPRFTTVVATLRSWSGTRWIALAIPLGCSPSSSDTAWRCAPAETSVGAACASYDGPLQDGKLPYEPVAAVGYCKRCVPRCNAPIVDGFVTAAALPSGSCSGDDGCDLGARLVCACPAARGPVNGYRCACEAGQWRCWMASQGGSPCANDVCDAGTD